MRRLVLALALVCASEAAADASPLELFGFGGRSSGLAGAGVGDPEGFASVYLNPAGLANARAKQLTLGTSAIAFRLRVRGEREAVDRSTALVFGGVVPLPLGGALAERVTIGLGFNVPNGALVRVDRPLVGEPTFVLLDNRADSVAIQVAVGLRVNERLGVGVGVLVLAALAGKITVANDAAGAFVSRSEQRLVTDVAPVVGAHYTLSTKLALGLTLRGPSRSDYDIEIETDLTSIPLSLPELAVAGNAQYDPGMVALGAAYSLNDSLNDSLTLLGDLEYRRWSAFPRPTEDPVLGNDPPPSPSFSDTVIPRLSVEANYSIGEHTIRGRTGYAFFLSPAAEMTGEVTLLDNHRHLLAAGLGFDVAVGSVPMSFDVWGQLHLLQPRKHRKQSSGEALTARGQVFAAGLTVGAEL